LRKKEKKNQECTWQKALDALEEQSGHPGPSRTHQDQCSTVPDITSESDISLLISGNENQPNDANKDNLA